MDGVNSVGFENPFPVSLNNDFQATYHSDTGVEPRELCDFASSVWKPGNLNHASYITVNPSESDNFQRWSELRACSSPIHEQR